MKFDFDATLATELTIQDIRTSIRFPYNHVFDLRRCEAGSAFAIDELVVKKLRNFWIPYVQLPTNLKNLSPKEEKELYRIITSCHGNVLVLVDEIASMMGFCQSAGIAYTSREMYVVKSGERDVQMPMPSPENKPIYPVQMSA